MTDETLRRYAEEVAAPTGDPAVVAAAYRDLWFAAATRDRRVTNVPVPGAAWGRCALVDPRDGLVLIEPDALRPVGAAPELVDAARALVRDWHAAGRPPITAWSCDLRPAGGLLVPETWRLTAL